MKKLLVFLLLCLIAFPAQAEKYESAPAIFETSYKTMERKEDRERKFISKEYLITTNEQVNAELQQAADAFDEMLVPRMIPADNARRNSRLDIEILHYTVGEKVLSTMVLARVSHNRVQLFSPFVTATYDLETGGKITLDDLFASDSPAWAMMEERVRSHVGSLFPNDPRNPEAVEALCAQLHSAPFTLSGYELTLHFEASAVYPGRGGLMHVRFFYDEVRPLMTAQGQAYTDNSRWKMVALTCDDGPSYGPTQNTLTNLRHAGARATFFVVGTCTEECPDLVMREFDQNHIVASHSYTHRSGYTLSVETQHQEVADHNALLVDITGETVTMFRAPGGTYPPWIEGKLGLPQIDWSLDTYDYTGKDANRIFYSVRNNVADGDIILCHDSGKQMHKAVPLIGEYLKQNGYLMVTVEELSRMNGVTLLPDVVYHRAIDGDYSQRTDSNIK